MEYEKKAQNQHEKIREMLPFAVYAAVPILIIVCIAFTFGVR